MFCILTTFAQGSGPTCGAQSPGLWTPGDRIANVRVSPERQWMQRPDARMRQHVRYPQLSSSQGESTALALCRADPAETEEARNHVQPVSVRYLTPPATSVICYRQQQFTCARRTGTVGGTSLSTR